MDSWEEWMAAKAAARRERSEHLHDLLEPYPMSHIFGAEHEDHHEHAQGASYYCSCGAWQAGRTGCVAIRADFDYEAYFQENLQCAVCGVRGFEGPYFGPYLDEATVQALLS